MNNHSDMYRLGCAHIHRIQTVGQGCIVGRVRGPNMKHLKITMRRCNLKMMTTVQSWWRWMPCLESRFTYGYLLLSNSVVCVSKYIGLIICWGYCWCVLYTLVFFCMTVLYDMFSYSAAINGRMAEWTWHDMACVIQRPRVEMNMILLGRLNYRLVSRTLESVQIYG